MVQVVIESLSLVLAFGMGLRAFQSMSLLHKTFFFQLVAYILIFILAIVVKLIAYANNVPPYNQWVYNLYMPIETGILVWAGFEYFKNSGKRFLIYVGYLIFLTIFISEICVKGIMILSNHGYVAEGILLLVIYLLLLYSQFTKSNNAWKRSPEIWISLGIVLYFGGSIPYLTLMNYLQESHSAINQFLFYFIIDGLANVRYLLLGLGFWLIYRQAVTKTSLVNE
ncbi:MAG TPA: hypothetical protein VK808_07695 [Bacteroidia bacterium]|nr:hypothetical protein [Bacteroidia bacterium]